MQEAISLIRDYLLGLQETICHALEKEDQQQKFIPDKWQYKQGGGGISRILEEGAIFEKGGVNFSYVQGQALPKAATQARPELHDRHFAALGVSWVMHPRNPYVPTSHGNVRFLVANKQGEKPIWWFGGGVDLTPYYGFVEDCQHWHRIVKQACEPFGEQVYPKFKQQCDDYFYLTHRKEPRGIGGIFFDDLNEWEFDRCFEFIRSVGDHYVPAYQPIVAKRKDIAFGDRERNFQRYRRGRYVEFNLVYDRGTLFGLQSDGRSESILMSLPPEAIWRYNWQPEPDSEEERLYKEFLRPRDWV